MAFLAYFIRIPIWWITLLKEMSIVFILPHDSLLSILFCSMILLYDVVMLFKLGVSYWSSHCVVTWYH